MRRPCATKALGKISRPYATETLHKIFVSEEPYAVLGNCGGVFREPYAFFVLMVYVSMQYRIILT